MIINLEGLPLKTQSDIKLLVELLKKDKSVSGRWSTHHKNLRLKVDIDLCRVKKVTDL